MYPFCLHSRVRLLSFPEPLDLAVSLRCHHHHPVCHILPHQTAQALHHNNPIKQQYTTDRDLIKEVQRFCRIFGNHPDLELGVEFRTWVTLSHLSQVQLEDFELLLL